jgi:hypothetical protein
LKGFYAERRWYVEQLNIDLSGEIDSINVMKEAAGFILFHLTISGMLRTCSNSKMVVSTSDQHVMEISM